MARDPFSPLSNLRSSCRRFYASRSAKKRGLIILFYPRELPTLKVAPIENAVASLPSFSVRFSAFKQRIPSLNEFAC